MYTTKSGDTWDVIAKEVYGSEYHADALMAAGALLPPPAPAPARRRDRR